MMKVEWKAYLIYVAVALAVLAPLLLPGFILTLDLVFTPTLPMPESISSSYVFHAGLHLLNMALPSDIIEKIILLSILLLASIGMHRLIRHIASTPPHDWGIYVAGIFFAVNPFTYSRLMAGQYAVLLGYALLPWMVQLLLNFARHPGWRSALKVGGLLTIIGIVSIHTLGAVFVLAVVSGAIGLSRRKPLRKKYLAYGLVSVGFFVLLSSYWLIPLLQGEGKTADTISSFTAADTEAFATAGATIPQQIFNILRLQGFWAETKNLYLLPQDSVMVWGTFVLALIGLVGVGAVYLWKKKRALVLWFGGGALVGMLLAVGDVAAWIADFPLLGGLREPHKMVMLVALAYSVFLAVGVARVLAWIRTKGENLHAVGAVMLLMLPFLITRVMFWGFDGQLSPRQYPESWFSVKTTLQKDSGAGKVLFLPWHQYMTFQFAGRIIASPAPTFFGERIVVSQDPELAGASGGQQTKRQQKISNLLQTTPPDIAMQLTKHDIRYIMLAKELDYKRYTFLEDQAGFRTAAIHSTLILYENNLWRQQ